MAWLLRQGVVLASLDIAQRPALRLIGSPSCPHGAARLRRRAVAAHSFATERGLDLAWLDARLVVKKTDHLGPFGVRLACLGARAALEAEAGSFERWGLVPGDQLEITD